MMGAERARRSEERGGEIQGRHGEGRRRLDVLLRLSLKMDSGVPKNPKEAKQSFEKAAEKVQGGRARGYREHVLFTLRALNDRRIDNRRRIFEEMKTWYRRPRKPEA
jgi:hypothetical protein